MDRRLTSSPGRLNVIDFPREYGLLSEFELEITESEVEALCRSWPQANGLLVM